jgi:hypothetical protein
MQPMKRIGLANWNGQSRPIAEIDSALSANFNSLAALSIFPDTPIRWTLNA